MVLTAALLAKSLFWSASTESAADPGLLFYLSGENGFKADYAGGQGIPAALEAVAIIPDGRIGRGFRCPDFTQILAYSAPGNIYAERGTVSFFWRARDEIGSTPFPIFQASYSDHSSIDMAWMRIDYNGGGFDAFVTDANLARVRISHRASVLPKRDDWIHFALSWDETEGVRFYIDGKEVGRKDVKGVFYAGLDKFGMHSDSIGPQDVVTMEQYMRGGDVDEIRIYDQTLSAENIGRLAKGETPVGVETVVRDLREPATRDEWWLRYGWNREGDIPPYIEGGGIKVRKVEIHDVYDQKQWFWKANDGIRETTWPGVYNRSRLPGRNDYFPRPDWNCYSTSGKTVMFTMPAERWNHIEIAGGAYGSASLLRLDVEKGVNKEERLFGRPAGQERTFHRLRSEVTGGKIRFENEVQETPIGEFSAYHVTTGREPEGVQRLRYTIAADVEPDNDTLKTLVSYIDGRYTPDERAIVVALPAGAPGVQKVRRIQNALPLVHILIPFEFRMETRAGRTVALSTRQAQRVSSAQADFSVGGYSSKYSYTWENLNAGLDGIAIDLPAFNVTGTHGGFFPLNIQVKDPLWPDRNMMDFTFSVKPGEAKTLWLDTRDRILPNGYPLYMTIAGAGGDFGEKSLEGAEIRLIFKGRKEAAVEHEADRFQQLKDNQGNMVEWHTNKKTLKLYDRFSRDIEDLFRVNPGHERARYYWSYINPEQGWPAFEQPKGPAGVPLWAFRQVEDLRLLREFIEWWIDQRQIESGEFGGGLSDDGDMTHFWPAAALMGVKPEKITHSLHSMLDAMYSNGMFTNGLNTIMTDQLHTYEEGINVQPQVMELEYGSPKIVERIMETAKALERITGIDRFGHRHIRSSYFSGSQVSPDPVWARAKLNFFSHLILHPGLVLVEFNGHPIVKKLMLELADGLLAHRKKDTEGHYYLPGEILFPSGEEKDRGFTPDVAHLFWAAWRWTGDEKYLLPIFDSTTQGDEFDVIRNLNPNLIDLLEKREDWGKRILLALKTGRLNEMKPDFHLSWLPLERARHDFFRHVAWQVTGDKRYLEDYYADQIQDATQRMSIFTEDHWWIDMVGFPITELQRSRLGGVAEFRMGTYPGHVVSWRFKAPATAESVAILVPRATTKELKIIAFNLESKPVSAIMTAWDVEPGVWDVQVGTDSNGDDVPDRITRTETVQLERTKDLEIQFEPKANTIVDLKLKSKADVVLWNRPDLGVGPEDVSVRKNRVTVTVHSLGSVDTPASAVVLRDRSGKVVAKATVPALKAPLDLVPKTTKVTLLSPAGADLKEYSVLLDPENEIQEITKRNNSALVH